MKTIYKLKENVSKQQMESCGFIYHTVDQTNNLFEEYIKSSKYCELFIPLEECEYGNRVIQYMDYGSLPEELDPQYIEDLMELGLVEEVEIDD